MAEPDTDLVPVEPDEVEEAYGPNPDWPIWTQVFLEMVRNTGNVRLACDTAGVHRVTVHHYKRNHADFAEAWEVAIGEAMELLEAVAFTRAVNGFSDFLLWRLLQAHSEKYRLVTKMQVEGEVRHVVLHVEYDPPLEPKALEPGENGSEP